MVNPYKCGRCKVSFDSDLSLLKRGGGARHHLPVSCTTCPYTICHVCYTDWLVNDKEGDVVCPDCETVNGFHAQRPNILPFACLLLAARASAADAMLVTEQSVIATPPLKKPKQEALDENAKPSAAASTPRAKSNPTKKSKDAELVVTEEELEALENHEIVSGMNEWLEKVVKVSHSNQRNVVNKVEKLCAGDGLSISTWPEGISFMKDSPVDLSMDFDDILNEAKEWESQHGRDPGNGWALKHPIMYLSKYQRFVLEEKLRNSVRPSEQSAFVSTPLPPTPDKQQQTHFEKVEPSLTPPAKPAAKKQRRAKPQAQDLEVTEAELVALENHEVESGMREWLEKVVKSSERTNKKILAKVSKLLDGSGLHVSTWPNEVSFMEGYKVNLSMDFDDMLNEAKTQEAKHGKDPGSGWAIRRPVLYLRTYQRFVLEEKIRKVQPAVVTPSPKVNKRKQDDSFHQQKYVASAPPIEPAPVASDPPTKPAAKKQKLAKPKSEEMEVTAEELEALDNHDIVSGMSEWLEKVVKVSKTNKKNVMTKVELLCRGEGIHVAGWPDEVFFMKGYEVNLSMDFDDMLKEEKAYETNYGKDKGNGWGLRHPISNLRKYQMYVLEENRRK